MSTEENKLLTHFKEAPISIHDHPEGRRIFLGYEANKTKRRAVDCIDTL